MTLWPTRIIVFAAIQLAACLYAWSRGGAPERLTASMMAFASCGSGFAIYEFHGSFTTVRLPLFAVDLLYLVGITALALRANRFWPMWVAALQLLAIGVHITRAIDIAILPAVYNRTLGKVAYPMIVLLVIGTRRHVWRASRFTTPDWSKLVW